MADELTPIAEYITREMRRNSTGDDAQRMRELNAFSSTECIRDYQALPVWKQFFQAGVPQQCVETQMTSRVAALSIWAVKVRQDGPWDHKPIIARDFHPAVPGGEQQWHLYTDGMVYYYEVWSNVHYGYVGKASGFSNSVLLDGAGLEQIGSSLGRFTRPQRDSTTSGMRAWDDPHDRAAIEIGIALYRNHSRNLTTRMVLDAVTRSGRIWRRISRR